MSKNDEKRTTGEIKATSADDLVVEGYALKFGALSEDLGGFREIIMPGALDNTDFSDVRFLYEHDMTKILGRNTSQTLTIGVDKVGLKFKCIFPDTALGRDTYTSIKRGDINKMSFEFTVAESGERVRRDDTGGYIREITDIKRIGELSVVSLPAYNDTDIAAATRSIAQQKEIDKFIMICRLWKERI